MELILVLNWPRTKFAAPLSAHLKEAGLPDAGVGDFDESVHDDGRPAARDPGHVEVDVLEAVFGGDELVQVLDGLFELGAQHRLVDASLLLLDQVEDDDGRSEPLQQLVEMFARDCRGKDSMMGDERTRPYTGLYRAYVAPSSVIITDPRTMRHHASFRISMNAC